MMDDPAAKVNPGPRARSRAPPVGVAVLLASLAPAHEVVVAVTLERAGREVAFERSRVTRDAEGNVSTTVRGRRGWRRPDGAQGGGGGTAELTLPGDDHDLSATAGGEATLLLRDPNPDAPVASWSLRFGLTGERWLPLEVVAPFELRVLFVPVRGRFVTTFEAWSFSGE